jgi:hypothetical protein
VIRDLQDPACVAQPGAENGEVNSAQDHFQFSSGVGDRLFLSLRAWNGYISVGLAYAPEFAAEHDGRQAIPASPDAVSGMPAAWLFSAILAKRCPPNNGKSRSRGRSSAKGLHNKSKRQDCFDQGFR